MKTLQLLVLFVLMGAGLTAPRLLAASVDEAEVDRRLTRLEKRISRLDDEGAVSGLKSRVSRLEHKVGQVADQGLVLLLFGTVCALWAQNTGRNSWLWFFLGLFFSFITVLVLLWKNSQDRDRGRPGNGAAR